MFQVIQNILSFITKYLFVHIHHVEILLLSIVQMNTGTNVSQVSKHISDVVKLMQEEKKLYFPADGDP